MRPILEWLNKYKNQKEPIFILKNGSVITMGIFLNDVANGMKIIVKNNKKFDSIALYTDTGSYTNVVSLFVANLLAKKICNFYENSRCFVEETIKKDFDGWDLIISPKGGNYKDDFFNSNKYRTIEKNWKIINKYAKKEECIIGCSSSATTGANSHYTYHNESAIFNTVKIYANYFKNEKNNEYCNVLYQGYIMPIMFYVFVNVGWKKLTIHLIKPNDKEFIFEKNKTSELIEKNKINTLFLVSTGFLQNSNVENLVIIHARQLDKSEYALVEKIITKNKFINVFASSDFLMEFLSIPKNKDEINKFNIIERKDWELNETNELIYTIDGKKINSENKFTLQNNVLTYLGRTKTILANSLKEKERSAI